MKRVFLLCFPLFAVFFLISPLTVFGQNFVQRFDKGWIDWSNRIVEAVGIGMPPTNPLNPAQARSVAKSEAESSARSSLLELLKGLRIDSRQSIKELIDQRDEVQDQLRGLLRNIQMVDVSYMQDGTVKAIIALRLTGAFADLLLPKNILNIESVQRHQKLVKPGEAFTGLVVDCRGFRVTPALVPLIVDEDGRAVYGSAYVNRDHAVQHGMVAYARNLDEIQKSPRVGPKPLNVRGLRTAKTGRSDIVISDADAAKIKGIPSNLGFLQKCRVIIVLD
ncbi:MAG: hypothetical protein KKE57_04615 [Proteobacteria bacterium]|nr:hypothetical protein [Pseudomonadota bacterium]